MRLMSLPKRWAVTAPAIEAEPRTMIALANDQERTNGQMKSTESGRTNRSTT